MGRLQSVANANFVALADGIAPLIGRHLHAPHGGRLLDPCCGKGAALVALAEHMGLESAERMGLEPFGCELHRTRAATAVETVARYLANRTCHLPHRNTTPHRVFHTAIQRMRIGRGHFNCLYLNPPFDHDDTDGRTELAFLKRTRPALVPDGVLVFVIPQTLLRHRPTAEYLSSWFHDIRLRAFPDDVRRFKEIVLFGRHNRRAAQPDAKQVQQLRQVGRSDSGLAVLSADDDFIYTLPTLSASANVLFRPDALGAERILEEAARDGVLTSAEWRDHTQPIHETAAFHPLTPLRQGHLINTIAAGFLNNHLLTDGDERLFIKGQTFKEVRTARHTEVQPDGDGHVEVTTYTDTFQSRITTLAPDGTIAELIGEELEAFLKRWIQPLTQLVVDHCQPLYQFNLNGYAPVLDGLNSGRTIPNTTLTGLAPAQKHAAAAAATRLDPRHENARDAIIVGQMGTGKTLMGPAVAASIRARRILVLCPPHLTGKWEREIRHVIPAARVMHLRSITDVDDYFAQPASADDPIFGILKETTARSASGWQHAYDWCGPIRHKPHARKKTMVLHTESALLNAVWGKTFDLDENPAQTVEVTIGRRTRTIKVAALYRYLSQHRTPRSPNSGQPLMHNDRPVRPTDLRASRRFVNNRREALHCFERRVAKSATPMTLAKTLRRHTQVQQRVRSRHGTGLPIYDGSLRAPTPIGSAKWPLATYIKQRYKGQIDLLAADEAHEFKGHDSDRGYAFGRLVSASKKVLLLTGTIYGGKASTLFSLLYRVAAEMPRQYGYRDLPRWVERYGVLQEVEKVNFDKDGKQTGNRRSNVSVKELPGASPAMLRWLLERSVFVSLDDMGFALPSYSETPHLLDLPEALQMQYDALASQLKERLKESLVRGDRSLLAAYLQALISWPDSPWRPKVVRHPRTDEVVAAIPGLPQLPIGVAPKEAVILKLIQAELTQQRNVLLLCQQTETLDITPQWCSLFEQHGIRAAVLRCEPSKREQWIAQQEASGTQVIITHPRRIQTGLDLLQFPTIVWIGQEFSVYTVKQANRRSYRIGQTEPVRVHFFAYRNTLQEQALQLISAKMAATERVDGNTIAAESLADLDTLSQGDILTTLAKILTGEQDKLAVNTLHDAFATANDVVRSNLRWIGAEMQQPETVSETVPPSVDDTATLIAEPQPTLLLPLSTNQPPTHKPSNLLDLLRAHGAKL